MQVRSEPSARKPETKINYRKLALVAAGVAGFSFGYAAAPYFFAGDLAAASTSIWFARYLPNLDSFFMLCIAVGVTVGCAFELVEGDGSSSRASRIYYQFGGFSLLGMSFWLGASPVLIAPLCGAVLGFLAHLIGALIRLMGLWFWRWLHR